MKLRILLIDKNTAAVVQRIFREYIAGTGLEAIADNLNRDGIPCPSAYRPEQNTHRSGQGWQKTTIDAILTNPPIYGIRRLWPDDQAGGVARP